jgi:NAD(P)-dependent dehydrogenase (short-subunit alcohol dehydrogenase family)
MAKIFITGSADGLGQLAAVSLVGAGHQVVLHARNEDRGREALEKVSGAKNVVTGDLSRLDEVQELARKVNELGPFDAIIHNAGVYQSAPEQIFTVNVLAPYVLTCLIRQPERLVYMSSGMHLDGHFDPEKFTQGEVSYSDSKLHVLMLAMAVARNWPEVYSNAVDPGWVPTKMGGAGAPDDLEEGYATQVWLATSEDDAALVSGNYFHHRRVKGHNPEADGVYAQEKLLSLCEELTGVSGIRQNERTDVRRAGI